MGAEGYPTKPITLLVGYSAGGTIDITARLLAKPLEKILGQPVIVVNRPGAGQRIAINEMRRSNPDGYTLCMSTSTPYYFDPHVTKVQYHLEDFKFIAAVAKNPTALVSNPDKPWKDFKGLVEYAKKHPGLTWASLAQPDKVFLNYIGKKEGIEWRPVAAKGGTGVITAVLGGHTDFGFPGASHYAPAKAGKLIVLANMGTKRLRDFPDAPTLIELGYDVSYEVLQVVTIPKGVPEPITKRLADAFEEAAKDPEYVDAITNKLRIESVFLGPDELEKNLREWSKSTEKIVKALEK